MADARDLSYLDTDIAALQAVAQAAVDVELFTIPLYMTALYSIQGMYPAPLDGQNLWSGLRPDPTATTANQRAFNAIFSVYIQEMFHLQLAANLTSAMGVNPQFKGPVYDGTTIPYVADLTTVPGYEDVKVELGPLDQDRIKLFLAIETADWDTSTEKPAVPFENWSSGDALPLFGTIGHLYTCMQEYIALTYTDGTTLWQHIYDSDSVQVDMFNFKASDPEYAFDVKFLAGTDTDAALTIATTMINAIVQQGGGGAECHDRYRAGHLCALRGVSQSCDRG